MEWCWGVRLMAYKRRKPGMHKRKGPVKAQSPKTVAAGPKVPK